MNMKMVEINIADDYRYIPVALFVDQPAIREFMLEMRKRLGLGDHLVSYESFEKQYQLLPYERDQAELEAMDDLLNELEIAKRQDQSNIEELDKEIWNRLRRPTYNLEIKVKEILKKYAYGDEFYNVLVKSIVTGTVGEKDFTGRPSRQRPTRIRTDRKWYWSNRRDTGPSRKGYPTIAAEEKEPERTVENAIKSYVERLNSAGPLT